MSEQEPIPRYNTSQTNTYLVPEIECDICQLGWDRHRNLECGDKRCARKKYGNTGHHGNADERAFRSLLTPQVHLFTLDALSTERAGGGGIRATSPPSRRTALFSDVGTLNVPI